MVLTANGLRFWLLRTKVLIVVAALVGGCGGGGQDWVSDGRLAISPPQLPSGEIGQGESVPVSVAATFPEKDERPLIVQWDDGGAGGSFQDDSLASTTYTAPRSSESRSISIKVKVTSPLGEVAEAASPLIVTGSNPTSNAEPSLEEVDGRGFGAALPEIKANGRADPYIHAEWSGYGEQTPYYSGTADFPVTNGQALLDLSVQPGLFALDITIVNGFIDYMGGQRSRFKGWALLSPGPNGMAIGIEGSDSWFGFLIVQTLIQYERELVPMLTSGDVKSAVGKKSAGLGAAMNYLVQLLQNKKLMLKRTDNSGNDPIALRPTSAQVTASGANLKATIPLTNNKACWYVGRISSVGNAQWQIDDGSWNGGAVIRGGRLYIPPKSTTELKLDFSKGNGIYLSLDRNHSLDSVSLNIIDTLWMGFGPTSKSFAQLPQEIIKRVLDSLVDASGHGELKVIERLNLLSGYIMTGKYAEFAFQLAAIILDGQALDATATAVAEIFAAAGHSVGVTVIKGYLSKAQNLFAVLQAAFDNWNAKESVQLGLIAAVP